MTLDILTNSFRPNLSAKHFYAWLVSFLTGLSPPHLAALRLRPPSQFTRILATPHGDLLSAALIGGQHTLLPMNQERGIYRTCDHSHNTRWKIFVNVM